MGEGNYNLVYSSLWDFKLPITCRKNLTTWDLPALLPIREEGVLRIFIALKNPSPFPGSNPQPLGAVASILTTTPLRRLPRGLRLMSAAAWLLGSRFRIPLGAWMFAYCVYMLCCPV
jgi:hypothetical protein